jgi:hypothetical protein
VDAACPSASAPHRPRIGDISDHVLSGLDTERIKRGGDPVDRPHKHSHVVASAQ